MKQNIDNVIAKKDLQEITIPTSDESKMPSADEVLKVINNINSLNLSTTDVKIDAIDTTKATATGIGNYDENTTVTFTTKIINTNLNTISSLTGITLSIDKTKKYYQLNDEIVKANEFKNHPLVDGYTIHYYYTSVTTTDMTNYDQGSGAHYVVIEASINDNYWSNQTSRIKVIALK